MSEEPRDYLPNWFQSFVKDGSKKILALEKRDENGLVAKITLIIEPGRNGDSRTEAIAEVSISGDPISSDKKQFSGPESFQQALGYRGEVILQYDKSFFKD